MIELVQNAEFCDKIHTSSNSRKIDMFDIITIGTATRDVFLTGAAIKVLKDPKHLKEIGLKWGYERTPAKNLRKYNFDHYKLTRNS